MTDQDLLQKIIQVRAGGRVERCHTIPHQGSYSDAAHSWGVAMLMYYIWPEDFPRLAIHCLSHDVPEAWVGDIPATTMRAVPGLRESLAPIEGGLNKDLGLPSEDEMDPADHAKLKFCDRMDFYLWCRDQEFLGNGFVQEALREITHYLDSTMADLPEEARRFWLAAKSRYSTPVQAGVMRRACDVT